MAHADFLITLHGGDFEGNWQYFAPGSGLEGSVQIVPDSDIRANHVWVRLQWHTEGRGDRDQGRVGEWDVFQGVLTAQTPVTYSFSFDLPREPWSYAGHYINLIWEVVVEIDVPMAPDLRQSQQFILAPRALVRAPGVA
jgi:hypothetical protein